MLNIISRAEKHSINFLYIFQKKSINEYKVQKSRWKANLSVHIKKPFLAFRAKSRKLFWKEIGNSICLEIGVSFRTILEQVERVEHRCKFIPPGGGANLLCPYGLEFRFSKLDWNRIGEVDPRMIHKWFTQLGFQIFDYTR